MKRLNLAFALPLFLALLVIAAMITQVRYNFESKVTDEYVRANVLMLTNPAGSSCSAVRIKTDSGHYYVLTAAHCAGLSSVVSRGPAAITEFLIQSIDEDGVLEFLKIIDADETVDLMLLESNTKSGIRLGAPLHETQKVHTVTHGGGMPMYRTDGAVIKDNWHHPQAPSGFIKTLTSAFILPGSSGGALLDSNNELVGIATNVDQWRFFSYFSTLAQIRVFLKDR